MKGGVNAVWATDKLDEFISRVDHHVTKSQVLTVLSCLSSIWSMW